MTANNYYDLTIIIMVLYRPRVLYLTISVLPAYPREILSVFGQ